jgi:hypothetical protein
MMYTLLEAIKYYLKLLEVRVHASCRQLSPVVSSCTPVVASCMPVVAARTSGLTFSPHYSPASL